MRPLGLVLTFVSVAFAMVLFRSTSLDGAANVLAGMVGWNGISLPRGLVEPFGLVALIEPFVTLEDSGLRSFVETNVWVVGLLGIALLAPNSLQVMARFEPALDFGDRPSHTKPLGRLLAWRPGVAWAAATSVLAGVAILRLSTESEFLYWQF